MNIIAVIPARSGSKGIPNKNIKKLAGIPLFAHSILVAQKVKLIDRIIVSTDSEDYAFIAKKYNADVPFLRPNSIAKDSSSDYDFVKNLLDWLISNGEKIPKYIIHLRPTTPLRDPKIIDAAINEFMKNNEATSLRSVHEMPETAYKQFELEKKQLKTIFTGSFNLDNSNNYRQSFPKTYSPNGYVDILRTSYILENYLLHGNKVMGFVTKFTNEIDTIDDLEYLEWKSKMVKL